MLRNRNIILPEAAKWRGRTVALYGGSFNPAHKGHRRVARECLKRLGVDAVWFLVSPGNPLKDANHMAEFDRRFDSIKALVGDHPRMLVSDIEVRLGTRFSADTIAALQKLMPHTRFIWVMGADNLATFDRWANWQEIARSLPIAVFDRPGYSIAGQNAKFAHVFGRFRVSPEKLGKSRSPAWAFLTIPRHPASATKLRQQMGETWLAGTK
ncbi:nicotinate-nucleotide adenylyltransferase [Kordiimonas lipolytica]|uniref:Probable nicotinate-nucleotide adenylyltransferase n=1 Tax=Kordiimonas lipolytica TaxID=1662421 RepID=A0ABV8UF87_9PROT|nr:nicotinate-nucleotide adenylyltransferase [Kordiimonas lipolytica]